MPIPMDGEDKLEEIFEEKLFVEKRKSNTPNAFTDVQSDELIKSEIKLNKMPVQDKISQTNKQDEINNGYIDYTINEDQSKLKSNTKLKERDKNKILKEKDKNKIELQIKNKINMENDNENIYEGIEDVYNTKQIIEGLNENKDKARINKIEEEFNKLRRMHMETLKMKSKIYKFIYGELEKMEIGKDKKIEELERENKELKEQIRERKEREIKYKEYVRKGVEIWREKIIKWMKEYKTKIRQEIMKE